MAHMFPLHDVPTLGGSDAGVSPTTHAERRAVQDVQVCVSAVRRRGRGGASSQLLQL
jgi:hypothetical protein